MQQREGGADLEALVEREPEAARQRRQRLVRGGPQRQPRHQRSVHLRVGLERGDAVARLGQPDRHAADAGADL